MEVKTKIEKLQEISTKYFCICSFGVVMQVDGGHPQKEDGRCRMAVSSP